MTIETEAKERVEFAVQTIADVLVGLPTERQNQIVLIAKARARKIWVEMEEAFDDADDTEIEA